MDETIQNDLELKAKTLTDELSKACKEADDRLAEFDKLNAQRELEKKKDEETIEDDRPTLKYLIAGGLIIGALGFGFYKIKALNNANTPVQG
ncbi:MAG: hypothetical protein LBT96_05450 [Campylobacteraceae bacterium]|nr:hypothetical protein [Campylobacteraceae bacterium]